MKTLTKRILIFAIAVLGTSTPSSALADSWCHAFFKATNGTEIQVDYQIGLYSPMRMPTYLSMKNIYVHAKNRAFDGRERVSMVFMTPVDGRQPQGSAIPRKVVFDGKRFTGFGNSMDFGQYVSIIKPVGNDGGGSSYHFEVAIIVDDQWLKDPVTGESNFKLFAQAYDNLCANPY